MTTRKLSSVGSAGHTMPAYSVSPSASRAISSMLYVGSNDQISSTKPTASAAASPSRRRSRYGFLSNGQTATSEGRRRREPARLIAAPRPSAGGASEPARAAREAAGPTSPQQRQEKVERHRKRSGSPASPAPRWNAPVRRSTPGRRC